MDLERKKKITLGIFVLIGLLILVGVIYYMGTSRHLFGDRITLYTVFKNVEGLKEGNNVRFSGIKVGVVKEVSLISDSTVKATLKVNEDAARYIKKDSYGSIETEGLMGNKVISISSGSENAPAVEDGDKLLTEEPIGMESIIKKINKSADDAARLTKNLADISEKVKSGEGPLGKFIYDSSLVIRVNRSLAIIESSGRNVKKFTNEINEMAANINEGDGLATKLIYDEEWANDVEATLDSLRRTSGMMTNAGKDLEIFMKKLNEEKGTIQQLLADSTMARDFHKAIINIKEGTKDLDKTLNTVENSWLLNLFSGKDD